MKTINIVSLAVLGWVFAVSAKDTQTTQPTNKVYIESTSTFDGCGCESCQNCSCTSPNTCRDCLPLAVEKEDVVGQTASSFPKPRKPCPPSGPGRR